MKIINDRKAQEISISVVVIAAIALLVLVVLGVILLNSLRDFGEGTACVKEGGKCVSDCDTGFEQAGEQLGCTEGTVCCVSKQVSG